MEKYTYLRDYSMEARKVVLISFLAYNSEIEGRRRENFVNIEFLVCKSTALPIIGNHGIAPTGLHLGIAPTGLHPRDCTRTGLHPHGIAPAQDCTHTELHPHRIAPMGLHPHGIAPMEWRPWDCTQKGLYPHGIAPTQDCTHTGLHRNA